MLHSMTGFGKASKEINKKLVAVEIKSLNNKYQDIHIHMPGVYREKELELKSYLSEKLRRGRIDVYISTETHGEAAEHEIDKVLAKKYYEQIQSLNKELSLPAENLLAALLKLPNVVYQPAEQPDDEEWHKVMEVIEEAVEQINTYRKDEGAALKNDFTERVKKIQHLLEQVEEHDPKRIQRFKERIQGNLKEVVNKENLDKDRLEQELIYYMEKLDISEEKTRLKNHCDYFLKTLEADEVEKGKKLNFIAQEMGREINTTGSKANDTDIQQLVVQMKEELEKIKEQVMNVV